jgi:excisionase family DNA binding protein
MARAMETLYSVSDAAKKLGGISKFTIYAWLSRGVLERTKVGGRTMIRESSLLSLLEQGAKPKSNRRKHKSGSNPRR